MADFFRSAFGYLSNPANRDENDFVGQYVELGELKLRVKSVIAEGMFIPPVKCHSQKNYHFNK